MGLYYNLHFIILSNYLIVSHCIIVHVKGKKLNKHTSFSMMNLFINVISNTSTVLRDFDMAIYCVSRWH